MSPQAPFSAAAESLMAIFDEAGTYKPYLFLSSMRSHKGGHYELKLYLSKCRSISFKEAYKNEFTDLLSAVISSEK